MGGPIRVNYNVIELPCIPSLYRISFWKEDCASPYTLFGADQSSLITLDPGIELHGGSSVLGEEGQRVSAQLCYFEKSGKVLTFLFLFFVSKIRELLNFYRELGYIGNISQSVSGKMGHPTSQKKKERVKATHSSSVSLLLGVGRRINHGKCSA